MGFVAKPILKNCKPLPIFGSGSSSPSPKDSKCKKKNLNIVWDLDESKKHPERMKRHQPTGGNGTSNARNRAGVSSNQYDTAGSRFDHGEVRKGASRADIIESIMVESCKNNKLQYPLPVLNLLRKYYTMGLDECTFSLVCYEVKPKQAVQTYNVNFKTLEQTNVASGKKKRITIVPNGSKITYDPTSVIRCTLTGEREEMGNIEWRRKHGADTSCERTPVVTRKMGLLWKYQETPGLHESFNTKNSSFSNGSESSHATKESWPAEADNSVRFNLPDRSLTHCNDSRSLSPKHRRSPSPPLSIPKIGQRDLLTPKPAGTSLTPRSAGRSPQNGFLGLKSGASSPRKDQSPVPNTYVFEKLGRSNKAGVALSEGGRSKSPMKDQFLRVDRSQERSKSQDRSRGKSPMKDQFVRGGRSKSPGGGRELSRDRDRKRQDGLSKSPKNENHHSKSPKNDRDHSKSPKKHPSPKRNSPFLRRDTSAPTKGRFLMPNNDSAGKIPTIDRKLPTPVPF